MPPARHGLRQVFPVDQAGTITVDGPTVVATIGQPGAVSRFTFTGSAGQVVTVEATESTLPDNCGGLVLVVARADAAAVPPGSPRVVRGAEAVAGQALMFSGRSRHARVALVNGPPGIVVKPQGRVQLVPTFTFVSDLDHCLISAVDVVADADRLRPPWTSVSDRSGS